MEPVWLKSYPKNIPQTINPDIHTSLAEFINNKCKEFGNLTAFENFGESLTYEQFSAHAYNFAAYLQQKLGLKKGDKIAIMMPNLLQYPIALYGAFLAGLIVVNVNPLYTLRELVYQVNDAGAETIVVVANFAHVVEQALPKTNLKNIIVTHFGDMFSPIKGALFNFVLRYVKHLVPKWHIKGAIAFKQVLREGENLTLQPVPIQNEDIAFLQYTGGTTGVAKGAILTHRNMLANLEQAKAWLSSHLESGKEIFITALPLYHIFSLTANGLVPICIGAKNVLISNPRDIPLFIKLIKHIPFTVITGVNTLYNALLNNSDFKNCDFSHVKVALGGGMAVQKAVAERWKNTTNTPLIEAYGLTETAPAACINPLSLQEYNGSIGLPVPSTDISIRNEQGEELSINEIGELWIKGPQVTPGYWQKPEETSHALKDGWVATGDIAKVDENGYVYLVDRKKDMIVVSGFNVYPNEVENIIAQMPEVAEVGVVGVPYESSGEVVKAFIVKKDPTLTREKVNAHCHNNLTRYKCPKEIEFRDDLPKTSVGKILRRALRDL